MEKRSETTRIVTAMAEGEPADADRLLDLVYEDRRQLAHKHAPPGDQTPSLAPTAVVHEAFLVAQE